MTSVDLHRAMLAAGYSETFAQWIVGNMVAGAASPDEYRDAAQILEIIRPTRTGWHELQGSPGLADRVTQGTARASTAGIAHTRPAPVATKYALPEKGVHMKREEVAQLATQFESEAAKIEEAAQLMRRINSGLEQDRGALAGAVEDVAKVTAAGFRRFAELIRASLEETPAAVTQETDGH